jgi:uncharacterized protein (DUF697 family)/tellurite resistance protein
MHGTDAVNLPDAECDAIVTLSFLAAICDGDRDAEEQSRLERVIADLGIQDVPALLERLRSGAFDIASAAREITTADGRQAAYETAMSVCYADGDLNPTERTFLARLQDGLRLSDAEIAEAGLEARALANAPLPGPDLVLTASSLGGMRPSQAGIPAISADAALDAMIRQHALIAGALEILPQRLATLAIIPLQMRLVHRIGADFGHQLDQAQAKLLLGVMGVGAMTQVLDGVARKVLGGTGRGLLGRALGGVLGGAAGAAAGIGIAFATTHALGHVAKQYYAQGRKLSEADLKALFVRFKREAEELLPSIQDEIRGQSEKLDLNRLMGSLKGDLGS